MKKLKFRFLTLIFSIFLSIIIAELILRIHYFTYYGNTLQDKYKIKTVNRPYYTLGYIIKPSPYWKIVYGLKPNLNVTFLGERLITNSFGWRDKELTRKKNTTFRILGLGDSYMFGWRSKEEDRYMDVLENRLGSLNQGDYETYVMAAPGYNLVMEEESFEKYGIRLEPDLVIYDFISNDFCLPNFIAPVRKFWSDSFIFLYARKAQGTEYDLYGTDDSGNLISDICSPENAPSPYDRLVGKENFEKALQDFQRSGNNTRLVMLVAIPAIFDRDMTAWLGSLPKKYPGINFIFLNESTKYLTEQGKDFWHSDLVIGNNDYHYSKKGNELVASWLYDELEKRNLTSSKTI